LASVGDAGTLAVAKLEKPRNAIARRQREYVFILPPFQSDITGSNPVRVVALTKDFKICIAVL
jgi:hypothetical protein